MNNNNNSNNGNNYNLIINNNSNTNNNTFLSEYSVQPPNPPCTLYLNTTNGKTGMILHKLKEDPLQEKMSKIHHTKYPNKICPSNF